MINKDYQLHFYAGILISFLTIIILPYYPLLPFFITTVVGVGKELIWDKYLNKGTPEYNDGLYTSLGGLVIELFYLFIDIPMKKLFLLILLFLLITHQLL